MLDVDLAVQHRRSFLYRGHGTRIEATFKKKTNTDRLVPVAKLFELLVDYAPALLMHLRQAEMRNEDGKVVYLIKDVRGRPAESFSKPKSSKSIDNSEELFFSSGVLFEPPANLEDYPLDITELNQQAFTVEVNSAFHGFTVDNEIQHQVRRQPSEVLDRSLGEFDLGLLAKLFPAELHEVRIGIEYFKERKTTLLAGIIPPSVKTRFFLELGPEAVYLLLEDESGGSRGQLPEFEGNFLGAVDRALDELDLYVGLSELVAAKL